MSCFEARRGDARDDWGYGVQRRGKEWWLVMMMDLYDYTENQRLCKEKSPKVGKRRSSYVRRFYERGFIPSSRLELSTVKEKDTCISKISGSGNGKAMRSFAIVLQLSRYSFFKSSLFPESIWPIQEKPSSPSPYHHFTRPLSFRECFSKSSSIIFPKSHRVHETYLSTAQESHLISFP